MPEPTSRWGPRGITPTKREGHQGEARPPGAGQSSSRPAEGSKRTCKGGRPTQESESEEEMRPWRQRWEPCGARKTPVAAVALTVGKGPESKEGSSF